MELSKMNKLQLRSACRDAKVSGYSKMTVEQMRVALALKDNPNLPPVAENDAALKPIKRDAAPVIRTEREVRNGVKRPLDPNGKCGQVWATLDELVAKGETDLTTVIHAIGDKSG